MDLEAIYREQGALLEGHFLLSSGNHSAYYLQSAKVLERPPLAQALANKLAELVQANDLKIDCVCAPALGGILAGYELARALGARFIFTERVEGAMQLRRGFGVDRGEVVLVCEDVITTGGSAVESLHCVEAAGARVAGFASLANRGFCPARLPSGEVTTADATACRLPQELPLFCLANFAFELYPASNCPLCKDSIAYKPGSRPSP